ncbi:MAG: hypothetical protein J1E62_12290 [Lachnospiraceae bacterium]|nr:hypothetical protein [Lachnospiraceae bacterium]
MKKIITWSMTLLLAISMVSLMGCSSQTEDPGTPPADVINPDASEGALTDGSTDENSKNENSGSAYEGDVLENAVSVRIGQDGEKDWAVSMYNNDAAITMLDYLSDSELLFPTYTYEEKQGFVAQDVRGNYTRNDETTITDVKAGELYLFSDGQLRLYFKDMAGADITATPVGYYTDAGGLTEAVQEAYESNKGDTWGVEVYFQIRKNIE